MAGGALPREQSDPESIKALLRRGGRQPGQPVTALQRRLLDATERKPRSKPRKPQLHEQRRAHDGQGGALRPQSLLDPSFCVEVEGTATDELARNRDEEEPANPNPAGEPPDLLIAARERIEVRPLAAPGNDRVSRRHHRLHAFASGTQRTWIPKIAAHDRGAHGGDNGGIGHRPHERGNVLATVSEAPYVPKPDLARGADDEDHAKRDPTAPNHAGGVPSTALRGTVQSRLAVRTVQLLVHRADQLPFRSACRADPSEW